MQPYVRIASTKFEKKMINYKNCEVTIMSVKSVVLNQIIPTLLDVDDKSEAINLLDYNPDALTELLDDQDSLKDTLDSYIYEIESDDEDALDIIVDVYESMGLTDFIEFLNVYVQI